MKFFKPTLKQCEEFVARWIKELVGKKQIIHNQDVVITSITKSTPFLTLDIQRGLTIINMDIQATFNGIASGYPMKEKYTVTGP